MNTGTAKKNNILNSVKNKFGHSLNTNNTNNTNNKNNLSNVKQNLINNNNNFESPDKATKRKHIELDLLKKDEVFNLLNFIKSKIDDIYEKYVSEENGNEWKEELLFELKQENVVDVSGIIPKSLNTKGSHLLEYTKFWILFIEIKFGDLELMEIVDIFNNSLLYEQNDLFILHDYLIKLFSENFDKEEILAALIKVNGKGNHFRVPEKVDELMNLHFKYLLDKHEVFVNNILINNINSRNTPISNKMRKLNNKELFSNSNLKETYSNNSKKENNPSSSSIMISNKIQKSLCAISSFNVNENCEESPTLVDNKNEILNENKIEDFKKTEEFIENNILITEINKFSEVAVQTENINDDDKNIKNFQSQAINTSIYNIEEYLDNQHISYSDLIERNKTDLNIERVLDLNFVMEEDEASNLVNKTKSQNNKKNNDQIKSETSKFNNSLEENDEQDPTAEDEIISVKSKKKINKKRGKSVKNKNTKK